MAQKRRVVVRKGAQPAPRVRSFRIGAGLPKPDAIREEMSRMRDVLMGRIEPPVSGLLALQEVADAYFARACEWEQLILEAMAQGRIVKTSEYNTLRTQEIRSFKEMSKSAAELGSRRLSAETLRYNQENTGRESA